jgi:hypothetical protein
MGEHMLNLHQDDKARMHLLIDSLPAGCKALVVVESGDTVAFEATRATGAKDIVYMASGIQTQVFREAA